MIIVSTIEGRECLLRCAQAHVEFDIELVDIDGLDWGVAAVAGGAILFRSFYKRLPVVTFAGAFSEWLCPTDDDGTFIRF